MKRFNPNPPGTSRRHHDLDEYAGVSGVYLLKLADGLYVGSSKDLRARLRGWAALLPGTQYATYPACAYRAHEQTVIDRLRKRGLRVMNVNDAVRQRKLPTPKVRGTVRFPKPRHRRVVTINGVTKPFGMWCRETGISIELALTRIKQSGWTEEAAVTTPKKRR